MDPAKRLRRLYEYDRWANRNVLDALEEHSGFENTDKTLSLMSHILAAEELWYRRIKAQELSGFEVWPIFSLEQLRKMSDDYFGRWQTLINENETDLDRVIAYHNTSGTAYETMLSDILHHVIIHGQHHRAQIATWLRMADITPPATDFIFYTRNL